MSIPLLFAATRSQILFVRRESAEADARAARRVDKRRLELELARALRAEARSQKPEGRTAPFRPLLASDFWLLISGGGNARQ